MKEYPDILTVEQAAEILQLHYRTVIELCRRGEMPYMKIGRFYRIKMDWLMEYVDGEIEKKSSAF
jgi:excisionase family DNA binding protein